MNLPIIFDDDALVAINKPAGLIVNRAESVKVETVQDWAEQYLQIPNQSGKPRIKPIPDVSGVYPNEFLPRAGIAHRIDKETSGILLIAKNPDSFSELQRQFKDHIVKKKYLAIAHGEIVPADGVINAPVDRLPWNKERFGIVPGGKESITRYHKQKDLIIEGDKFSVVELFPESGRTHQIRVHLKYISHPILGDYLYAGRKTQRNDREWAPRVMLHANWISFIHPVTGKPIEITAPIPDDMNRIINS
jgi:23S rRNA pseudouridine1911/1915/1917 synthase